MRTTDKNVDVELSRHDRKRVKVSPWDHLRRESQSTGVVCEARLCPHYTRGCAGREH